MTAISCDKKYCINIKYGFELGVSLRCSKHREVDMINVVAKRCEIQGCSKIAAIDVRYNPRCKRHSSEIHMRKCRKERHKQQLSVPILPYPDSLNSQSQLFTTYPSLLEVDIDGHYNRGLVVITNSCSIRNGVICPPVVNMLYPEL
jgi:hypothetical protein